MEPITATAIIAALAAGTIGGATELGKKAIVDGYEALKSLLKNKFGDQSRVAKSVAFLETMPDSDASKALVKEAVADAKADQDPDIHKAAQALLDQMKAVPGGEQHIQNAIGTGIAQADRGSSASVTINHARDKEQ